MPNLDTLRYLPARKPGTHPAMVAPFALPSEPAPGRLQVSSDAVLGVHLTLLANDGKGKALVEHAKKMVGRSIGSPIVVAPVTDSMGLIIAEGIEDALSFHQATGLGAWAAGSAGRMPALADAVPEYVDCVTIAADGDEVGEKSALELQRRLRERGFEVVIVRVAKQTVTVTA